MQVSRLTTSARSRVDLFSPTPGCADQGWLGTSLLPANADHSSWFFMSFPDHWLAEKIIPRQSLKFF